MRLGSLVVVLCGALIAADLLLTIAAPDPSRSAHADAADEATVADCPVPCSVRVSTGSDGSVANWDFGDGTRFEGRRAAAHVYTEPGEYRITRDGAEVRMVSVVSPLAYHLDSGGAAVCLSVAGDFDDCPVRAERLQIDDIGEIIDRRRDNALVQLRAGETFHWRSPGPLVLDIASLTVNSYGDGPRPRVVFDTQTGLQLDGARDVRLQGIELVGPGSVGSTAIRAVSHVQGLTLHDISVAPQSWHTCINLPYNHLRLRDQPLHTGVHISNSTLVGCGALPPAEQNPTARQGGYAAFLAIEDSAITNNELTDLRGGEHAVRLQAAARAENGRGVVVAGNTIGDANYNSTALTLRFGDRDQSCSAGCGVGGGVDVYDNQFRMRGTRTVTVGQLNRGGERPDVRDVWIHDNRFTFSAFAPRPVHAIVVKAFATAGIRVYGNDIPPVDAPGWHPSVPARPIVDESGNVSRQPPLAARTYWRPCPNPPPFFIPPEAIARGRITLPPACFERVSTEG